MQKPRSRCWTIPATGHVLQLNLTAPLTTPRILDWLAHTAPSR